MCQRVEIDEAIAITSAKNDTDKAAVGFVVTNASVASGVETVVFPGTEGRAPTSHLDILFL